MHNLKDQGVQMLSLSPFVINCTSQPCEAMFFGRVKARTRQASSEEGWTAEGEG